MKAFLLAAGFGERLKPLTDRKPKPLVLLAGIPSICYSLCLLKESGITDVVCNIHYLADTVVSFFERHENFGFNITFSREDEILGTGGGLKKCEELLDDDDFVLINSDVVTDLRIGDLIGASRLSGKSGMLALFKTGPANRGTVSVVNGKIVDFKNFLSSGVVPSFEYMGIAVLNPVVFRYLSPEFSSVVYTGYTGLIENQRLGYYEHTGLWEDIGSLDSYYRTQKRLLSEGHLIQRVRKTLGLTENSEI
jgi:mannose-1-phosphate guanylyltransferase